MVSCFISRIVILIFGTLYPAYASYKAVRTKNVKEYVKWMMYWIVFALFTCFETLTDLFLSFWFPFYYELKIITVIYLLSPATNGSSILYRKFVHPVLTKKEQEIDEYISKAKEQGYHTMVNLGSKGVTYATSLIMQTAIKGGGGLVSHLRKSYSLGDLSEEHSAGYRRDERDEADHYLYEDYRRMRRSDGYTPRQMNFDSNVSDYGGDAYHRPMDPGIEEYRGRVPSSSEISSGYSSGDPMFYEAVPERGQLDGIVFPDRYTRVRTRASSKNVLPKRSSVTEGVWSPGEMHEGRGETDNFLFSPFLHSSPSVLLPANPSNREVNPENQNLIGGLTRQQLIAILNASDLGMQASLKTEPALGEVVEGAGTDAGERKTAADNPVQPEGVGTVEEPNAEDPSSSGQEDGPKSPLDNCKKYGKRPAPAPPSECNPAKNSSSTAAEVDEDDFRTPSSSPKPERKNSSHSDLVEQMDVKGKHLDVPIKTKAKAKKISKRLHLPKFPFWNPKNEKLSSGSENSSVASTENIVVATETGNRNDLEFFIPLKGEEETTGQVEDASVGDNQ